MEYHLFVCRHAEAQNSFFNLPDIDRELTSAGKMEAAQAGNWLLQTGKKPDKILSSSARRALSTTSILSSQIGFNQEFIISHPELYNANIDKLLLTLAETEPQHKTIVLVGHNPGLSDLVTALRGSKGSYTGNIPTGSIHHLQFDFSEWPDILYTTAKGYASNVNRG